MAAKKRWLIAVIAESAKPQPAMPWHRKVRAEREAQSAPPPRKVARA